MCLPLGALGLLSFLFCDVYFLVHILTFRSCHAWCYAELSFACKKTHRQKSAQAKDGFWGVRFFSLVHFWLQSPYGNIVFWASQSTVW